MQDKVVRGQEKLTKKLTVTRHKLTRHIIAVDESRIIYANIKKQVDTVSSENIMETPSYFNMQKPGQAKDLKMLVPSREKNYDFNLM